MQHWSWKKIIAGSSREKQIPWVPTNMFVHLRYWAYRAQCTSSTPRVDIDIKLMFCNLSFSKIIITESCNFERIKDSVAIWGKVDSATGQSYFMTNRWR